MLSPAFAENNIPVVFATDKNFALYLSVAIRSLIDNSSAGNNYDIIILDTGMDAQAKELLLSLSVKSNISVRILEVIDTLNKHLNLFKIPSGTWFTPTTYMRIFIPELFRQYEKVIYLDCDLIILADIAELYNTGIGHCSIGAVPDYYCEYILRAGDKLFADYKKNVLKMDCQYINAGVLIFNICKWIEKDLINRCLEFMKGGAQTLYADNCVINSVCNGSVHYLELNWNVTWYNLFVPELSQEDKENLKMCIVDPKVVHYVSGLKPWNCPGKEKSDIWWSYAKKLPHYQAILEASLNSVQAYTEKRAERHLSIIAEKNKRIAELEQEIALCKSKKGDDMW